MTAAVPSSVNDGVAGEGVPEVQAVRLSPRVVKVKSYVVYPSAVPHSQVTAGPPEELELEELEEELLDEE